MPPPSPPLGPKRAAANRGESFVYGGHDSFASCCSEDSHGGMKRNLRWRILHPQRATTRHCPVLANSVHGTVDFLFKVLLTDSAKPVVDDGTWRLEGLSRIFSFSLFPATHSHE